jgi:hypothetical protein
MKASVAGTRDADVVAASPGPCVAASGADFLLVLESATVEPGAGR